MRRQGGEGVGAMLLIVDDDPQLQGLLEQAFSDAGYDVALSQDGVRAMALLEHRSFTPDVVIVDLHLGEGPDGWRVAQRARQLHPEVPVIYMTGKWRHDMRPEWAPVGVPMMKPFTTSQMLAVTQALLAG
jgi:DNA-binding response OmpR family regulator